MPERIRKLAPLSLGKSPCEIVLAKLLNEHPRHMRKVTHLLHDFRTGLNRLDKLAVAQNREGKKFLYRLTVLWFYNNKGLIDRLALPEVVRTHTHTVLKANWREWLKERQGKQDE